MSIGGNIGRKKKKAGRQEPSADIAMFGEGSENHTWNVTRYVYFAKNRAFLCRHRKLIILSRWRIIQSLNMMK